MLTGIKLAFVGGDARIIEVIKHASELDAGIVLIGFDQLATLLPDTVKAELSPGVFADVDAVVLPVSGMDDEGKVQAQYSSSPLVLDESHFEAMPRHSIVFTGIARKRLSKIAQESELRLFKLMELDEVAIHNSIPSAEGAIQYAMQNTDITIHGSRSVVLGFGRCGVTLARMLDGLGAKVTVCARSAPDLARIEEMGLRAVAMQELLTAVQDAEIIYNTVPAMVLSAEVLAKVPKSCVIIDIASNPGGTDFRYAEKRGIKAILAPSLPGIVAPKTSGLILARTLCRLLWENA
ncbi:dipicolinate synthase subunit DpsA [Tumebacillus permanentifrigoris]|uniref:Dipicolinate synthase subunit A n=1 Tax=Tumebacillus permanentifrigoris TaxID=378543 RepID=A0A316D7K6_9BACL|nr:dipicolinate synthase subunit DpsA [Tumebacillus permanentifrigoris]PWK12656.1 dipicolinate synthase subunit A [Tumebacillus permanentifrigoris]